MDGFLGKKMFTLQEFEPRNLQLVALSLHQLHHSALGHFLENIKSHFTVYSGVSRTKVIGSRTSFLMVSVLAYTEICVFSRSNPFQVHNLAQSYHPTQSFKQEVYNTKSKI